MTFSAFSPTGSELDLVVVTPTRNRRGLLSRLASSLDAQADKGFRWLLIDDASDDDTLEWFREEIEPGQLNAQLISMTRNVGKAACLNRAFSLIDADFCLVVDSDDWLAADGLSIVRAKAREYRDDDRVGGVFFGYLGLDGHRLGGPVDGAPDLLMTRAQHDAQHDKYDGCVGYFRRTTRKYRYPEFPGETYIGPTVLQLLMAPHLVLCFTSQVVGFAEYQPGGLTHQGRALRISNPLGMMAYTALNRAQARSRWSAARSGVMFNAYRALSGKTSAELSQLGFRADAFDPLRLPGNLLAAVWRRRHPRVSRSAPQMATGASADRPHDG